MAVTNKTCLLFFFHVIDEKKSKTECWLGIIHAFHYLTSVWKSDIRGKNYNSCLKITKNLIWFRSRNCFFSYSMSYSKLSKRVLN